MDEQRERAVFAREAEVGRDVVEAGAHLSGPEATAGLKASPDRSRALRLHRTPPEILRRLPAEIARERLVLPLGAKDGALVVASAGGLTQPDVAAIQLRVGMPVRVVRVEDEEALREAIESNYEHVAAIEAGGGEAPADRTVALADSILEEAVRLRASDIHIQPHAKGADVRFRIDGVLVTEASLDPQQAESLTSYLKVLAGLDYSQRGRPLDGHITRRVGRTEVDIRLSSIGTAFGRDKVVLRVLDRGRSLRRLSELGFDAETEALLRGLLREKQGLILVAGPTGSGKTTTLDSAVLELDAVQQNVVTLEEPVEALLPGVTQIPVTSRGEGLGFAEALKAVLRQDPDVIVVGELRDRETVEIAVQAALSGHMVLSSIHAIDAVATVFRLLERGVEPYMLAASLTGVMSQRLLRNVCPHCAESSPPRPEEAAFLRRHHGDVPPLLTRGMGCNRCNNTGYLGREAVAEVLPVTEDLRALIAERASPRAVREAALAAGYRPMVAAAAMKVALGRTTVAEVLRVLSDGDGR